MARVHFCLLFFVDITIVFSNETAVFNQIFKNYVKNIRPVKDPSEPVYIEFVMQYLYILEMNEAQETITVNIDYVMSWTDEFLKWEPSNFIHPVSSLVVQENLIWKPDIVLDELLTSSPLHSKDNRRVRIAFDGRVTYYSPQIVTMSCHLEINDFPFDSQYCRLSFGPWVYELSEVAFQNENISASILSENYIQGNSEWRVISFDVEEADYEAVAGSNHTAINFYLVIKRKPVYYICVLIIPTFTITTLCLFGIFAPSSSTGVREEKISLGLTTLLAASVILSIVAAEMPKTTTLPLLGYFVLAELIFCAFAILVSIFILIMHQRVIACRNRPPKVLLHWLKYDKNIKSNWHDGPTGGITASDDRKCGVSTNLAEFHELIAVIRKRLAKEEYENELFELWNKFFHLIDLLLLVLFQVANIIMSACLFL